MTGTMEYKSLRLEKNEAVINQVIERYHFLEQDRESLSALYQALLPLLRTEAFYIWNPVLEAEKVPKCETTSKCETVQPDVDAERERNETQALVFLSLGKAMDEFQSLYMDSGCLQEAYMIECIGLELLTEAYEEFVKQVQNDTHKWAKRLEFVGDNCPIETLPDLYRQVFTEPGPITYSEQCILSPKKSVAFFLTMSDKKVAGKPCHICSQCKNTDCMFRQAVSDSEKTYTGNRYSYGYQRFFGQQKQLKKRTNVQQTDEKKTDGKQADEKQADKK